MAVDCRFGVVGYGCMTCIGNSGPLSEPVTEAIEKVMTKKIMPDFPCHSLVEKSKRFLSSRYS